MSQIISKNDSNRQLEDLIQSGLQALNTGNVSQAIYYLDKVLSVDAKHAQANYLKGVVSFQNGDAQSAVKAMRKALKREPDNYNVHNGLGSILQSLKQFQHAQKHFRKACELNPAFSGAFNNLAVVYKQQGRLFDAEKCYRKAIKIDPDYGDALNNLGLLLQDLGSLDEAIACFRQAIKSKKCQSKADSNLLFALNYQSGISPQKICDEHNSWGNQFPHENSALMTKRGQKPLLKIGYVSPDFRAHSVAYFFEPLLTSHNHEKYQVYCYYNNTVEDEITKRLQNLSHRWINISSLNDQDVIEKIIEDNIDILVDLTGHTGKNRLEVFARRAAPIQISWLGYPNTTGLKTMDFRFTDGDADPKGDSGKYYSEKLIRLTHGFLCYRGNQKASFSNQIPSSTNGFITFGSFNNMTKVSKQVLQTWAEILLSVPNSRLILKANHLNSQDFQQQVFKELSQAGINRKRVKLYGSISGENEHLKFYNNIDIGLDTFPYHGTTTTCEALWMGVPVITLMGQTHVSRVGPSLLKKLNLASFIAMNKEHYVQLAVRFADNLEYIQHLKENLRQTMIDSDLCNSERFASDIEQTYEALWNDDLKHGSFK